MNQIGLIGLATMGSNLALNFAGRGVKIAVFNRDFQKTQALIDRKIACLTGYQDLKDMVASLERPRKIVLLVRAGSAVDDMISQLSQLMDTDDIIIDMGNSNWLDTRRRNEEAVRSGFNFVGCGISGGAEGALRGPCIMPGGNPEVVDSLLPLFKKIAALDFEDRPCVTNTGLDFAGHYVKMVHNGIEYAIMQGLAEIYSLLKYNQLSQERIIQIFEQINTKESWIGGFLLDVTIRALESKNTAGDYLLPLIDQAAGSKGTGRWTVEAALELGVAVPTISEAVFARTISQNEFFLQDKIPIEDTLSAAVNDASVTTEGIYSLVESVYAASFLQGLDLIARANNEYNLRIDIGQLLRIWQGGCIIRTQYLTEIDSWLDGGAFELGQISLRSRKALTGLLVLPDWPSLPVITSGQNYLSGLIQAKNHDYPTNLVQLQRNIFGEHQVKLR